MSHWRLLLSRSIAGLGRLREGGQPVPAWVLGGGTGLMLHAGHRLSKDIDAFIDDPQFLSFLSPRLVGEEIWRCTAYSEAANHLRLVYPEGEIDFIVAGSITGLPPMPKTLAADDTTPSMTVEVEPPAEIALKKLIHRGGMLKVRDIFDIAVIDADRSSDLRKYLFYAAPMKRAVLTRLAAIPAAFAERELTELAIAPSWQPFAKDCLARMNAIAESIPD